MAGIVWERAQDGCSSPILSSQLSRASLGRTYWHINIQPAMPANQGPLLKLVLCRNCDPHNLNRALRFHAHNHPGCTSCLLLNVLPTHTDKFSPLNTICDNFLPHRQKVRHREMRSHHRAGTLWKWKSMSALSLLFPHLQLDSLRERKAARCGQDKVLFSFLLLSANV